MDTTGRMAKVLGFTGEVETRRVFRDLDGAPYVMMGEYNRIWLRTVLTSDGPEYVVTSGGKWDYSH